MDGEIQEGINWDVGVKPRRFFKLVILRPTSELSTHSLDAHVRRLWEIWSALKRGVVPSLGPEYPVDPAGLQVLLGFGHRFFDRADLARPAPEAMIEANRFPQPEAGAGSPILPGSGMLYDQDTQSNDGDQELVVQFLADTPMATHRAQVETWKYLYRNRDMATGELPISIHTFFDGFAREDRRSWIDFHDGISNLRKGEERRQVVAIKPDNAGGQDWTLNGTYMVFMRLPINLTLWEQVPATRQELLVGRTKRSGCPLIAVDQSGLPVGDPRCPVAGTEEIIDPGNEQFREPSSVVPPSIEASHVQRANHHRRPAYKPDSRRIYRQGFEFLERAQDDPGFRIGLNFVSFVDDPDRVFHILTQPDWLGNLSFGGSPEKQEPMLDHLITVRAAGIFYVPPIRPASAYPGSDLLLN